MHTGSYFHFLSFFRKISRTLVGKSGGVDKKKGFTLIELLVTMSIVTILLLGVSSLFMTFLLSSTRTTIVRSLKAEGTEIVRKLEFELRDAQAVNWHGMSTSINCTATGATTILDTAIGFDIIDPNNVTTHLLMNDEYRLEIDDTVVNSSATTTSSPVFTCYKDANTQKISIKITFTLSAAANTSIKQDFTTFVQLRNS